MKITDGAARSWPAECLAVFILLITGWFGSATEALAGVVVMACRVVESQRLTIEPAQKYFDNFETLTDADGRFRVPGKGFNQFRRLPPPRIAIFKSGYP